MRRGTHFDVFRLDIRTYRGAFTDFDPFWELVSGPAAAATFGTKDDLLDQTFGPEVHYSKGNETTAWAQSPRAGNQFLGHMDISAEGALTVTLYDAAGTALWSRTLAPERSPGQRGAVS